MRGKKNNASAAAAVSGLTLKEEVRDAMLEILRDKTAPATARTSAGRALAVLCRDDDRPSSEAPAEQQTIAELDEEIAKLRQSGGSRGRDDKGDVTQ